MKEIPQLKKRIVLLFTVLTGLVLGFACFFAAQITTYQLKQANSVLFNSYFSTIFSKIQNQGSVNMVEIYQFEKENNVFVELYDNGEPIITTVPTENSDKEALMELVGNEISFEEIQANMVNEFSIENAEKENWQGRYQQMYTANGNEYGVLLIKSNAMLQQNIQKNNLIYGSTFLFSLVLLLFLSKLFANIVAKPIVQAYKKQAEFTAAASHDLRTPIAIIKTSGELLVKENPQAEKDARKIVSESDHLANLVNDLLLLSAKDADILLTNIEKVDIEALLILLYENHLLVAEQSGYRLIISMPETILPKVAGDERRIYQILSSFLSNAFEYSTKGTDVEIKAQLQKKNVLVKIIDHGNGIAKGSEKLIFDQFYREDKNRTQKDHFGLGLNIAQKLAEAQNAKVYVEETLGGGATFVLRLEIG